MSLLGKKWKIKKNDADLSLLQQLLVQRGLMDEAEQEKFLACNLVGGLYDPLLMQGMEQAVALIREIIQKKERIMIYGDYDVDGVTGTAILIKTLQALGAQVSCRLPHRVKTGYGMHLPFIEECQRLGVKLIITTDCGVTNEKEIARAKELGLKVIVTDHHTPPEKKVSADVILNPRQKDCAYPDKELCGAAIAFKLASALLPKDAPLLNELIGLATLGAIADCAALLDEQRIIVAHGLRNLSETRHKGLLQLKKIAGIADKIDTQGVGFRIAPRLNAAGRLDDAMLALQILLNEDRAVELANSLEALNSRRQIMTAQALKEAEVMLAGSTVKQKILIAKSSTWHAGIIGLVAGKLCEKYNRPIILMEERGDKLIGSCRSPEYFSVIQALKKCGDIFEAVGGHSQAAGFTLDKKNWSIFKNKIKEITEEQLSDCEMKSELLIDAEVAFSDISENFFNNLQKLEPFGAGNSKPLFLIRDSYLQEVRQIGETKKHLRLKISQGNKQLIAVGFGLGEFSRILDKQGKADVVFSLEENIWNNKRSIELRVVDFGIEEN